MVPSSTVRAPSSTANLGPGFDVFGLALDAFFDEVTLTRNDGRGITITSDDAIPTNPDENTAGLVAKAMAKKFAVSDGIEIKIKKGVPAGFGMGSSAASAAACAVAFNRLYRLKLETRDLVELAGIGERASAGSIHYDNVAASVAGGFVIVRTDPLKVIQMKPPKNLYCCIAVPRLAVPKKKTRISRQVVPKRVGLKDSIKNLSNASLIVAGFAKNDVELIGSSVTDVIIEPARMHMIPGFEAIKKNAVKAGALGVTISGAGPSVIALCTKSSDHKGICAAMQKGFASAKTRSRTIICKPSTGAVSPRQGSG